MGSVHAVGAPARGTFLIFGFALHNTAEALAIVTPLSEARPKPGRLAVPGLIAGALASVGAVTGASPTTGRSRVCYPASGSGRSPRSSCR